MFLNLGLILIWLVSSLVRSEPGRAEGSLVLMDCPQDLISKVIAEYLADLNSLNEQYLDIRV